MKPKPVVLGVLLAFGIVGIVAGAMYFSAGPNASKAEAACGYPDCDWTGSFSLKPGDLYPPTCTKCGRASVFQLSICRKCDNRQILNERLQQLPGLEDRPARTTCDECGGPLGRSD